jgi:hypothetical protein
MGARVDIRVHPEGDRRPSCEPPCDAGHPLELGRRFQVQAADAALQG